MMLPFSYFESNKTVSNPNGGQCTCVFDHDGTVPAAGVGAGFCDAGFFAPTAPSPFLSSDSASQAGSRSNPCAVESSHMCANKENEVAFCEI